MSAILEQPTKLTRNYHGEINAQTIKTVNGITWDIHTGKGNGGRIYTNAQECTIKRENGYISTSFMMFQSRNIKLIAEKARATEKNIRAQHEKALQIFDEKMLNLNGQED